METDLKLTEQLRNCLGISEILACWGHSTVEMAATLTCRRELMETAAKLTEQLRNCSGISEIFDGWRNSTTAMAATLACRAGMPKADEFDALCQ